MRLMRIKANVRPRSTAFLALSVCLCFRVCATGRDGRSSYRTVVQWRPADGDRRKTGRLRTGRLHVAHAVRRTAAVHVNGGARRIGGWK